MINYTYTATGAKVSQQLATIDRRGGLSTRRDYAGPFVFVNNAPGCVSMPHERFVYVNGNKSFCENFSFQFAGVNLFVFCTTQGSNLVSFRFSGIFGMI